jgi:protein involved in polysaccharide export with SLBB domain
MPLLEEVKFIAALLSQTVSLLLPFPAPVLISNLDELEIKCSEMPSFNRIYKVNERGEIKLGKAGILHVAGLSETEATKRIVERIAQRKISRNAPITLRLLPRERTISQEADPIRMRICQIVHQERISRGKSPFPKPHESTEAKERMGQTCHVLTSCSRRVPSVSESHPPQCLKQQRIQVPEVVPLAIVRAHGAIDKPVLLAYQKDLCLRDVLCRVMLAKDVDLYHVCIKSTDGKMKQIAYEPGSIPGGTHNPLLKPGDEVYFPKLNEHLLQQEPAENKRKGVHPSPQEQKRSDQKGVVEPGDRFCIVTDQCSEQNWVYEVDSKGCVLIPFVGLILVGGLLPSEASDQIAKKLAEKRVLIGVKLKIEYLPRTGQR